MMRWQAPPPPNTCQAQTSSLLDCLFAPFPTAAQSQNHGVVSSPILSKPRPPALGLKTALPPSKTMSQEPLGATKPKSLIYKPRCRHVLFLRDAECFRENDCSDNSPSFHDLFPPYPHHCSFTISCSCNHTLPTCPGLIVKDSYWHWPERDLAGNAIDFYIPRRTLRLKMDG